MFKIFMIFCLTGFILLGCATVSDRTIQVEPGMGQKQVLDVMGEPKDRTFRGSQEKWVYEGSSDGKSKLVVFEDGKVVELINVDTSDALMHKGGKDARKASANRTGFCVGSNNYGKYPKGGGCNMYGCWPKGGYCNAFGCSSSGRCTVNACPKKIDSYQCVE